MPSLPVVRKVREFFDSNAEEDGKQFHPLDYVGLQIRAFQDKSILPLGQYFDTCFSQEYSQQQQKQQNKKVELVPPFFLATLHQAVRDLFAKKYGTGRVVTLAPARGEQKTGSAHFDQEALVDMFLLAFSKDLFVSPGSTFGSFVAAYAQTHPRVVFWDGDTMKLKCSRAQFLEPCFASWKWYDKLQVRKDKLSCKLEEIPKMASGCTK